MVKQNFLSNSVVSKVCGIFCLSLLLILVSDVSRLTECNNNNSSKVSVVEKTTTLTGNKLRNQHVSPGRRAVYLHHQSSSQQKPLTNDEYEKLSKNEQKQIDDNRYEEEQTKILTTVMICL